MDPLTVIGIFLLGVSAGAVLIHVRFRAELRNLSAGLDRIQIEKTPRAA